MSCVQSTTSVSIPVQDDVEENAQVLQVIGVEEDVSVRLTMAFQAHLQESKESASAIFVMAEEVLEGLPQLETEQAETPHASDQEA